ncbi:MAG: imidazole glycerol phosphate synthase subunit HisH [Eubacteriales bacterium]|nr:imidazole glycerol phosphate synthase subunit HisH [Eubacteriales bacterium]
MIGILDYGIGNVGSIRNMLKKAGAASVIVHTAEELSACHKLILPGVGAFDEGMERLANSGMRPALDEAAAKGKPVLGICLGMQMLGLSSEEGRREGLGYIRFRNVRFQLTAEHGLKVPHMGWDVVDVADPDDPLVRGITEPPRYYFVHSYYAVCEDAADALLACDYGISFTAAVRHGNVWGTQFHPEKSHRFGMALLKNFAEVC